MDIIYKRQSIRKYNPEPIPKETILSFVKMGMNAPSAGNQQFWYFVIINEHKTFEEITLL